MFTPYIIGAFIIMSMIIAVLFLKLSNDSNDEFILYWGTSWVFYSLALFCFLAGSDTEVSAVIKVKKLFDMYSIQMVLFGIYKFTRIKIPGYWMRFSIYLSVWLFMAVFLDIDSLSSSFPIALFDLLMVGMVCYLILRYWKEYVVTEKIFYCLCFAVWGIFKAYLSIYETNNTGSTGLYLGEILYANFLNVSILLIYFRHMKLEKEKAEERYKIIVENVTDVIFYYTFKPVPAFLYMTPSIESLTGYPPQTFYNNPKAIIDIVDKQYFEIINELFFTDKKFNMPYRAVFQVERKDRELIWVEMNVSVIRENSTTVAIEGVLRDVTEMKEVQEDLTTSKKQRDLMLSYISHELKTPITSILGYVNAIRDGIIDEDERRNAMDIISRKSQILERMIMDLFQLSQLETNQYSFTYQYMDGEELAEYICDHAMLELEEAQVQYDYNMDREKLKTINIIADPIRVDQVITNLIINAIKYSNDDNYIKVDFKLDIAAENVIISVADRGMGIAKEDIPYIFNCFFKSSNPETAGIQGRGLGLALSKEIIEAHGGSISVESKIRKGSVFTVTLPVYND